MNDLVDLRDGVKAFVLSVDQNMCTSAHDVERQTSTCVIGEART